MKLKELCIRCIPRSLDYSQTGQGLLAFLLTGGSTLATVIYYNTPWLWEINIFNFYIFSNIVYFLAITGFFFYLLNSLLGYIYKKSPFFRAKAQVVESVADRTRTFINSADSLGSPITVSVEGSNYFTQDSGNRYWLTSTNASYVINSACATGDKLIILKTGIYSLTAPIIVTANNIKINGEVCGDENDPATTFVAVQELNAPVVSFTGDVATNKNKFSINNLEIDGGGFAGTTCLSSFNDATD